MSIRHRVLLLMTILLVPLVGVSIYFASTLLRVTEEIENSDRAVRALLQGFKARAAMNRQLKEYYDASDPDMDDQREELLDFEDMAREGLRAWLDLLSRDKHPEAVEQATQELEALYAIYEARAGQRDVDEAPALLTGDGEAGPLVEIAMLEAIGEVLQYELYEIKSSYRRTLRAAGSIPWRARAVEDLANKSDLTLGAFLAAAGLRTDILRQIQAVTELAVTGSEEARTRMARHRVAGEIAVDQWERAVVAGNAYGASGTGWDIQTPLQMHGHYGRVQEVMDEVLPALAPDGEGGDGGPDGPSPPRSLDASEADSVLALIEEELEDFADGAVIPILDLSTSAYEEQIRGYHAEIRRELTTGALSGLVVTVLLCVVIAGFSIFSVHRIVHGLERLRAGTARVARGEWAHRIGLDSHDEFGKIAGDFDAMMDVLSQTTTSVKNLEAEVEERMRVQVALEEARETAERAAAAKTDFLANMSHEIRTPMNGVIGMTGLLLNTEVSELQREYLGTIQRSADSLLAIINDVLDFSKVDAGMLELDEIDFNLRRQLESMNDILAWRAQEKGLEYTCLIESDVPIALRGDPGRLQQVLTNLVSNAVKFTHHGDISVRVGLLEDRGDEVRLEFEVVDTGIGIDEARVEDLFDAFTQADTSTTREFGGTGLGLSISKRLVALMGGEIGAKKNTGEGSLFWFTVTLAKQPAGSVMLEAPEHKALATICEAYVLIVDDNSTNRLVLKRQLESWGFAYDEATGAQMALHKLREAHAKGRPFTLAILDMQMPYMDGEELGRAIKEDSVIASTILIMMTSIGWRKESERVREIGFASFLTKPVKQSQLFDCLASALGVMRPLRSKASNDPLAVEHRLTLEQRRATRILLVEDNPTNQIVALSILKNWGFHTDAVGNGLEALSVLSTTSYDVVLMDVQMPELDGLTATRRIRSGEAHALNSTVPVIAMTAHALKGDREKCLAAGMNDYVSKPIKVQELLGAIESQVLPPRGALPDPAVSAPEAGNGAIDLGELLAKVGDDLELVETILSTFEEDSGSRLLELASERDPESMAACAHALKSASGNIGAHAVYGLCMTIESKSKDGRAEEASALIPALKAALVDFNLAAAEWVRRRRDGSA